MKRFRWIPGALALLAAQIGSIVVGCEEADPHDAGGGSGGGSAACDTNPTLGGTCGFCELSLSDYCTDHECDLSEAPADCWGHPSNRRVVRSGCGLHRVEEWRGFAEDLPLAIDVYDKESGKLVYHFSRSAEAEDCEPDVRVGEEPQCSSYSIECDSGYACVVPPYLECHGSCYQGCLAGFANCAEAETACLNHQNGVGGEGGAAP